MNQTATILLLCLNFISTAVLATLFFKSQEAVQNVVLEKTEAAPIDLSALQKPITEVGSEIAKLNEIVQRFSTSSVQYDFLKREMDQLAVIDQTIGAQAQATAASRTEKNTDEVDVSVAKLGKLSEQVKGQLQGRRKTMLTLISSLEKELTKLSGALPQKIQLKPDITVPPVAPTPAIPTPSK